MNEGMNETYIRITYIHKQTYRHTYMHISDMITGTYCRQSGHTYFYDKMQGSIITLNSSPKAPETTPEDML